MSDSWIKKNWAIAEFCINAFILETLFFQTTFPLAWKKDSHFCAILSISWPSWFIISTTQVHNPYLMVQLLSAFDISMRTYFLNYSSHFYKVNVFAQFQFLRYRPVFCSPYFFFQLEAKMGFQYQNSYRESTTQ